MEAGNVAEFVDNLTMQDEMARYGNHLYYFYGIRYNEIKRCYYVSVDQFGASINAFEKEYYYYEGTSVNDCLEHLITDKYWDGKDFYEVEKYMTWVDG